MHAYEINLPEQTLILDALSALRNRSTIDGKLVDLHVTLPGAHRADASIDLVHDKATSHYVVQCKSAVDRKAQIDQVRRQLTSIASPGLLIAPYITKELAEYCRSTDVQFIDTHGNAYLRAPGLYVLITGAKDDRRQQSARGPKGLTYAAGLRVAFALLSKPALVTSPFKDIAHDAGVSLGTANNVLADLERRGYLLNKSNAKGRKLLEPRRLMEEWVMNYPTTLRPKLKGMRFGAPDPSWWKHTHLEQFDCAWGSEVAAQKMTSYLKPSTQTLYVQPGDIEGLIKTLVKEHRLKPDPKGDVDIVEKFWNWRTEPTGDTAPSLLVYADLLAIFDPRAQEAAEMIKEQFIDPAFNQG